MCESAHKYKCKKDKMASPPVTYIPGYDSTNKNANSCLYRVFGKDACTLYNPGDELDVIATPTVVVHSYGFYALVAAGILSADVKRVVVLDGWIPELQSWGNDVCPVYIPENISWVFFFPTVGNRTEYPLEAVVRQAMVARKDITVVRGVGFGHNMLFAPKITEERVREVVQKLIELPDEREAQWSGDVVIEA